MQNALASKLYIEKKDKRGLTESFTTGDFLFMGKYKKEKKLPDYIVKQIFLWLMGNEISEPLFATYFFPTLCEP